MSRPQLKTVAATIRVTPELKAIWTAAATAERRSMANLFEVALREYVQRHPLDCSDTSGGADGGDTPGPSRKSSRPRRASAAAHIKQD